jgi:hypothetical protein
MIIYIIPRFCTLGQLKKGIAILCLTALLLTTSSISYYYWLEEKLHEQSVFAAIEEGSFKKKELYDQNHTIHLVLKEANKLPEGYIWEEEGREFSYNGMFYDIVSLKKTAKGWELIAASDEEEAAIVANKNSSKKGTNSFKLSNIQWVFLAPAIVKQEVRFILNETNHTVYKASLFNRSLVKFSPPPEAI